MHFKNTCNDVGLSIMIAKQPKMLNNKIAMPMHTMEYYTAIKNYDTALYLIDMERCPWHIMEGYKAAM